ncbi:unnamed protein product, partial [Prunus brigantina]
MQRFVTLSELVMASADSSLIMRDHLYSLDERLRRGRPPPLLKGVDEDIIIDGESALETTPVIDPASISRCCIERGLFPAVPLFFQYPCGTSKGWSEWVDRELKDPSTCDVLSRAGVLDAIFTSKACDIHIEAKMLRHVFTPTLEDGTAGDSPETGLSLLVIATNAVQAVGEVTSISQGAEDVLPSPPLGEPGIAASTSSQLLAAPAPTSSCLGTPDKAAGTSSQLLAVLLPTSSCPDTPVIAAGTLSQLPAIPPLIPPLPVMSDTAADTSSLLSAVPLPTSSCLDTPVTANSFMAFKAFFDGGVTILRSIDELLPLCHLFNGYATFQGALVYPETVEVLRKFMDKHGSFMEVTDVTSTFSRCTALRALGLVL